MTAVWDAHARTDVARTIDHSEILSEAGFETMLGVLQKEGIVIVRGFSLEPADLVAFARRLGTPEPGVLNDGSKTPDMPRYWINEITTQKKPAEVLGLHTAGAHEPVEPGVHLLLMVKTSPRPADPEADNGQSRFARVEDAVVRMSSMFGEAAAESALEILRTTPISTEFPADSPRVEPIVSKDSDGTWSFRYWTKVRQHAVNGGLTGEQLEALRMFDEALNAETFEFTMEKGDLVVLDNRRTAHGRRAYPAFEVEQDGSQVDAKRMIFNMHVRES
ncbi:TauD/TfdA family dioxygenase [Lentzea sp.]|uniref:TauD/TfdA family dioxygenase n=1 Tax=Lentzea sp. TaxID=56099 RepID=UPI002C679592|nr:TauD/TfdA family dioxygenase [Lentzea sp.]HUQ56479.1 TauD/TfdA family dioxygenase [Lentzea sp.]